MKYQRMSADERRVEREGGNWEGMTKAEKDKQRIYLLRACLAEARREINVLRIRPFQRQIEELSIENAKLRSQLMEALAKVESLSRAPRVAVKKG